jgi:hypothetical protein
MRRWSASALAGVALSMFGAFGLTSGERPLPANSPGAIPEWLAIGTLLGGFALVYVAAWTRRHDR